MILGYWLNALALLVNIIAAWVCYNAMNTRTRIGIYFGVFCVLNVVVAVLNAHQVVIGLISRFS